MVVDVDTDRCIRDEMVATLLLAAAAALLPLLLLLLSAATSAAAPASAPAWRLAPLDTDEMLAENPFERPCLAAELGAALATCRCSTGSDNGTYVNCDHVATPPTYPSTPSISNVTPYDIILFLIPSHLISSYRTLLDII